jgi:hypothetical protein
MEIMVSQFQFLVFREEMSAPDTFLHCVHSSPVGLGSKGLIVWSAHAPCCVEILSSNRLQSEFAIVPPVFPAGAPK